MTSIEGECEVVAHPGTPASMTPTVTMCLPVCEEKMGDPGPLSEGYVLCVQWTCLGPFHMGGGRQPSSAGREASWERPRPVSKEQIVFIHEFT